MWIHVMFVIDLSIGLFVSEPESILSYHRSLCPATDKMASPHAEPNLINIVTHCHLASQAAITDYTNRR